MLKFKLNLILIVAVLLSAVPCSFGQTTVPATREQVDRLIAVLKSDATRKEKADACRLLALVGTKEAIPVLASLLGDEELSHMARYALEPMPYPEVDAALREALGNVEGRQLVGVIDSLGVRRDSKAVEPLTALLENANADVAQGAARALGAIGTPDAAEGLQKALAKAPAANRLALCEGLFRCAERLMDQGQTQSAVLIYDRLRALPNAAHQVRGGALRGAILARGKDGLDLLKESLGSKDYILFSAAVQTAQEMPGVKVTQALAAELSKLPEDNAILVIETLGKRGDEAAISALSAVAKNGPKAVRLAAIEAMPMIGDAAAAPALVELVGDSDGDIAKTAKECLAAIPGQKIDAVVMDMLGSKDADDQLAAVELIGRRRMASAVPALLKAAGGSDAKVRPAALKRVGELGAPIGTAGVAGPAGEIREFEGSGCRGTSDERCLRQSHRSGRLRQKDCRSYGPGATSAKSRVAQCSEHGGRRFRVEERARGGRVGKRGGSGCSHSRAGRVEDGRCRARLAGDCQDHRQSHRQDAKPAQLPGLCPTIRPARPRAFGHVPTGGQHGVASG